MGELKEIKIKIPHTFYIKLKFKLFLKQVHPISVN